MATWIGLQAAQDALDPGRPLRALLPDEPMVAALDERLTLLHLLQMESGLDFEELYGPGSDVTRMLYLSPAMWQVPATSEQAFAPGEHFAYSSGDTVLASLFWQRSLDGAYERWIRENFQAPLGLTTLVAEADASGVQVGSSYAYLTPRDWLRVGQLWLDAWHGRSTLLPRDWLRASVAPRASDPRGRYGRGFWLNTAGAAFPGLPDSLFYAGGNAGQYVVVIPEWELVVVRLGLTDADASSGVGEFLRSVSALRDSGALADVSRRAAATGSADLEASP
jgi:CubicO group peptidase (beta-lactamase class C family)